MEYTPLGLFHIKHYELIKHLTIAPKAHKNNCRHKKHRLEQIVLICRGNYSTLHETLFNKCGKKKE